jgi:hypothetical protein
MTQNEQSQRAADSRESGHEAQLRVDSVAQYVGCGVNQELCVFDSTGQCEKCRRHRRAR